MKVEAMPIASILPPLIFPERGIGIYKNAERNNRPHGGMGGGQPVEAEWRL